jgi:hypothetical protein
VAVTVSNSIWQVIDIHKIKKSNIFINYLDLTFVAVTVSHSIWQVIDIHKIK